jgi:hypothetical protein
VRHSFSAFAGLFFGTTWYAWNTYFDRDNFYGVFFAANATWATCLGPICKFHTVTISNTGL